MSIEKNMSLAVNYVLNNPSEFPAYFIWKRYKVNQAITTRIRRGETKVENLQYKTIKKYIRAYEDRMTAKKYILEK